MPRFTNIHIHIFNTDCAPDRFLMVIPSTALRYAPGIVKWLLSGNISRALIHRLSKLYSGILNRSNSAERNAFDKYIAFLNIGLQATQLEVFQKALEAGRKADPDLRLVALTLNMDFMDSEPNTSVYVNYESQLEEVKSIKRLYPEELIPFLCIDPRHSANEALVNWSKNYFEKGFEYRDKVYPYFAGIKLYPALGFFPFDPRLTEMYRYAEENGLPVITHCTRVGSQYIGNYIESLIPAEPAMIGDKEDEDIRKAQLAIYQRIQRYYNQKGWIKNNKRGKNDFACDLFGHPENYIPVLKTYPKLKICLAHLGGANEIRMLEDLRQERGNDDLLKAREVDTVQWFDKIWQMMKVYPNLYTDISYTVSSFEENEKILNRVNQMLADTDNYGGLLRDRVLFGTDFFMTEQEKRETELYEITRAKLFDHYDALTRENTARFLGI